MEYSHILKENDETQETEKEVIICEDESLMKYLVGEFFFLFFLII